LRLRLWHKYRYPLAAERTRDLEVADRPRCLPRTSNVQRAASSARSTRRQIGDKRQIGTPMTVPYTVTSLAKEQLVRVVIWFPSASKLV